MKIHEYQAKEILKRYDIPVPQGFVTSEISEVAGIVKKLPTTSCVVKAQIHAGGRGKGGGVKLARNAKEASKYAKEILGMNLITHQTGSAGQLVRKILIEQGVDIKKELYLGATLDRSSSKVTLIASNEGGMEIEKIAEENPELIIKTRIDIATGVTPSNLRKLTAGLGLEEPTQIKGFHKFCKSLYHAYMELDCTLIEINPLVITSSNELIALDCKVNLDDNALSRHPDLAEMRDLDEEDPTEVEASAYGLNYIKLDGNVSCMVNGAGLAMATMDIIKHYGGEPANFLDVGGTADATRVARAFEILTRDPAVKAILVNIFGGIVRCDRVANGIVEATKIAKVKVPLVVRLEGTNAQEAREILKESGINVITATSLSDAAEKVVNALSDKESH